MLYIYHTLYDIICQMFLCFFDGTEGSARGLVGWRLRPTKTLEDDS